MIEVVCNGKREDELSLEEFDQALTRFEQHERFEVWLTASSGQSICMLRNGADAWLMYLLEAGDPGYRTQGDAESSGMVAFTLANGQEDEYPRSWCIDLEQCYQVLFYFFVNDGKRPEWVSWVACDE